MVKFQRDIKKNNQTILKAIKLETKKMDRIGWPDTNTSVNATPDDMQKGLDKNKGKGYGNDNPVTTVTTQAPPTNQQQGNQQGHQQDNNGNGNSGNQGKGNPHNK
jgi:hypothetical protein